MGVFYGTFQKVFLKGRGMSFSFFLLASWNLSMTAGGEAAVLAPEAEGVGATRE